MNITLIIILLTSIVSILAFSNKNIFDKLKLNPYMIYHKKEYYRILSHAMLHADWTHLFFNMFTLFFFGKYAEHFLSFYFNNGILLYVLLYILGIIIASIPSVLKHKNNHWYNSIGASGAVAAVLFTAIFFDPKMSIYLFLIPIPIPGFVFGIAYLAYSQYMSKKDNDNINHDAHFAGAIFGFIFPVIFKPELIQVFINNLIYS
ncbi:MAG: rhomboid family intramembrane serine protease [Bacteroidales bacterium]|nr:rhomboid family intramembrane serine protease [Bacteroidales bacterium]MBN2757206.1 rhomboid family intramembrane serine protease [Bacteroidales bacterium]